MSKEKGIFNCVCGKSYIMRLCRTQTSRKNYFSEIECARPSLVNFPQHATDVHIPVSMVTITAIHIQFDIRTDINTHAQGMLVRPNPQSFLSEHIFLYIMSLNTVDAYNDTAHPMLLRLISTKFYPIYVCARVHRAYCFFGTSF